MSPAPSMHNEKWLPWLTREIEALGLKVTPSVGNFLLIHFPKEAGRTVARTPMRSCRAVD